MLMDLNQQTYTIRKNCRSNRVTGNRGNRVTREILYIHVCVGVCKWHTQKNFSIRKLVVTLVTMIQKLLKTLKIRGFQGNRSVVTATKFRLLLSNFGLLSGRKYDGRENQWNI